MLREYIVIVKDKLYVDIFKKFLKNHHIVYEYLNDSRSFLIKVSTDCINCISKLNYIIDIDYNLKYKVEFEKIMPVDISTLENEDFTPSQAYLNWGIEKMQIPTIWQKGIVGTGVKVAVLDTGISNHDDLKVVKSISFVNGETPDDMHGHGTMMAGIIAGRNTKQRAQGLAYACDLYNVKVMPSKGVGSIWDLCEGIQWCIDNKIKILNMSLAPEQELPEDELTALKNTINKASKAGLIPVFSTGNYGRNVLYPPASDKPSLAIGATNINDVRWEKSNYGIGINYVAPGVDIVSTIPGNKYGSITGTSPSAAQVSGLIALLLSQNPKLNIMQIKSILTKSAVKLGSSGYNAEYGNGRVNAPSNF